MDNQSICASLVSQYHASLEMMRLAVAACPPDQWEHAPPNLSAFWRVAHHTIWFADLYLSATEEAFKPWPKHVDDHQHIGPYRSWDSDEPPRIGTPTTQADMLEFIELVKAKAAKEVPATPLDAPSGFSWLTFTKFEAHVYNIRHIQHHTAQLAARLREHGKIDVKWVGKWPRSAPSA